MFTEIASMPARTRISAYSGCTDGAWPQIEVRSPRARALGMSRRRYATNGGVTLIEHVREDLRIAVGAKQKLREVVRAD